MSPDQITPRGILLPAGSSVAAPEDYRARWVRPDGTTAANIYAYRDAANVELFSLLGKSPASGGDAGTGMWFLPAVAAPSQSVIAITEAGPSSTVLTGNNKSSYVRHPAGSVSFAAFMAGRINGRAAAPEIVSATAGVLSVARVAGNPTGVYEITHTALQGLSVGAVTSQSTLGAPIIAAFVPVSTTKFQVALFTTAGYFVDEAFTFVAGG